MALIFPGSTPCGLCDKVLESEDGIVAFPAFLPREHRLHYYSDGAFHHQCFQTWPDRLEFERLYKKFRSIWDSRPKNLTTVEEMEAWGEQAFKDWYKDDDFDKPLEEYVLRPRDSVRERKLARRLRELPEEERFAFISNVLKTDHEVALVLASACLRDKKYFEAFLEHALKTDYVNVETYLKRIIPKLGYRKVLQVCIDKLATEPKGVERAMYYLWVFRPQPDPDVHRRLLKLDKDLKKKGLRNLF